MPPIMSKLHTLRIGSILQLCSYFLTVLTHRTTKGAPTPHWKVIQVRNTKLVFCANTGYIFEEVLLLSPKPNSTQKKEPIMSI